MSGICYDDTKIFRKVWINKKNMKIAYKMFSSNKDFERTILFGIAEKTFKDFDCLQTPTVFIKNEEDIKNFILENKDFKFNPEGYNLDSKQGWKFGELGILASNWLAWNNFLKSDYDYLILMEDDLMCNENLPELISKYIEECPKDFH